MDKFGKFDHISISMQWIFKKYVHLCADIHVYCVYTYIQINMMHNVQNFKESSFQHDFWVTFGSDFSGLRAQIPNPCSPACLGGPAMWLTIVSTMTATPAFLHLRGDHDWPHLWTAMILSGLSGDFCRKKGSVVLTGWSRRDGSDHFYCYCWY